MAEQNNQPAQEMTQQELSEQIKIRREKLAQLQAEGKDPFEITKCEVTHHSDEIKDNFEEQTYHGESVLLQHSGQKRQHPVLCKS